MSEEITEAKFWRDRFYQVSIMNEKSMEIIKLLMDRANKKEWVGLTDEELSQIRAKIKHSGEPMNNREYVTAVQIETQDRLKEKNNA